MQLFTALVGFIGGIIVTIITSQLHSTSLIPRPIPDPAPEPTEPLIPIPTPLTLPPTEDFVPPPSFLQEPYCGYWERGAFIHKDPSNLSHEPAPGEFFVDAEGRTVSCVAPPWPEDGWEMRRFMAQRWIRENVMPWWLLFLDLVADVPAYIWWLCALAVAVAITAFLSNRHGRGELRFMTARKNQIAAGERTNRERLEGELDQARERLEESQRRIANERANQDRLEAELNQATEGLQEGQSQTQHRLEEDLRQARERIEQGQRQIREHLRLTSELQEQLENANGNLREEQDRNRQTLSDRAEEIAGLNSRLSAKDEEIVSLKRQVGALDYTPDQDRVPGDPEAETYVKQIPTVIGREDQYRKLYYQKQMEVDNLVKDLSDANAETRQLQDNARDKNGYAEHLQRILENTKAERDKANSDKRTAENERDTIKAELQTQIEMTDDLTKEVRELRVKLKGREDTLANLRLKYATATGENEGLAARVQELEAEAAQRRVQRDQADTLPERDQALPNRDDISDGATTSHTIPNAIQAQASHDDDMSTPEVVSNLIPGTVSELNSPNAIKARLEEQASGDPIEELQSAPVASPKEEPINGGTTEDEAEGSLGDSESFNDRSNESTEDYQDSWKSPLSSGTTRGPQDPGVISKPTGDLSDEVGKSPHAHLPRPATEPTTGNGGGEGEKRPSVYTIKDYIMADPRPQLRTKITKTDMEELKGLHVCWRCRNEGHIARECPYFRTQEQYRSLTKKYRSLPGGIPELERRVLNDLCYACGAADHDDKDDKCPRYEMYGPDLSAAVPKAPITTAFNPGAAPFTPAAAPQEPVHAPVAQDPAATELSNGYGTPDWLVPYVQEYPWIPAEVLSRRLQEDVCLYCGDYSHRDNYRSCPKRQSRCDICGGWGHTAESCATLRRPSRWSVSSQPATPIHVAHQPSRSPPPRFPQGPPPSDRIPGLFKQTREEMQEMFKQRRYPGLPFKAELDSIVKRRFTFHCYFCNAKDEDHDDIVVKCPRRPIDQPWTPLIMPEDDAVVQSAADDSHVEPEPENLHETEPFSVSEPTDGAFEQANKLDPNTAKGTADMSVVESEADAQTVTPTAMAGSSELLTPTCEGHEEKGPSEVELTGQDLTEASEPEVVQPEVAQLRSDPLQAVQQEASSQPVDDHDDTLETASDQVRIREDEPSDASVLPQESSTQETTIASQAIPERESPILADVPISSPETTDVETSTTPIPDHGIGGVITSSPAATSPQHKDPSAPEKPPQQQPSRWATPGYVPKPLDKPVEQLLAPQPEETESQPPLAPLPETIPHDPATPTLSPSRAAPPEPVQSAPQRPPQAPQTQNDPPMSAPPSDTPLTPGRGGASARGAVVMPPVDPSIYQTPKLAGLREQRNILQAQQKDERNAEIRARLTEEMHNKTREIIREMQNLRYRQEQTYGAEQAPQLENPTVSAPSIPVAPVPETPVVPVPTDPVVSIPADPIISVQGGGGNTGGTGRGRGDGRGGSHQGPGRGHPPDGTNPINTTRGGGGNTGGVDRGRGGTRGFMDRGRSRGRGRGRGRGRAQDGDVQPPRNAYMEELQRKIDDSRRQEIAEIDERGRIYDEELKRKKGEKKDEK